jgi:glutamine cyclotransferase
MARLNIPPKAAATWLIPSLALMLLAGCDSGSPAGGVSSAAATNIPIPQSAQGRGASLDTNSPSGVILYTYEVVHTWPHDRGAFTQGLVYLDGALLESTGLYGQSSLRKVELETGKVLKQVAVPTNYFAEGLALMGNKLFQLTWQNGKGFVYDLDTFHLEKEFFYPGEGWGFATDGQSLILSDGSDRIRFLDPETFAVERVIRVTENGRPVNFLNELEYVKGEIYANVWKTSAVVRIDPATGRVTGEIDFTGLLPSGDYAETTDVMNGIAYDAKGDRLFVTGKCWPKLFEVRLKPK